VELEGEGNPDEYLPYVKAGYAVLAYDLDGPDYTGDPESMKKAFEAFKASRAGLVNARNALEYAINNAPEIDPKRIYAAGHSSAATHALLFAAHEPRLAGVIAYAPAADLPKWFGPRMRLVSMMVPGCVDFITQSSPSTHASQIKCPTFLFHAEDDMTCSIEETKAFSETLKQQGTPVALVTVTTGDHYESMINEGIPAGIKWLGEQTAK
jgi:dipeptidyl aminopeptidase/acylaminoacyl peptidase